MRARAVHVMGNGPDKAESVNPIDLVNLARTPFGRGRQAALF